MTAQADCIFCKIVSGEAPARKFYESHNVLAILDIGGGAFIGGEQPIPGRSLIIPKIHAERWYDLEDEVAAETFVVAKVVANKIKRAFDPEFVDLIIRGGRIPHTHIILQPEFKENDPFRITFLLLEAIFRPKFPDDALDDMFRRMKEA
jgi:histidine triad (HIT) family protein